MNVTSLFHCTIIEMDHLNSYDQIKNIKIYYFIRLIDNNLITKEPRQRSKKYVDGVRFGINYYAPRK